MMDYVYRTLVELTRRSATASMVSPLITAALAWIPARRGMEKRHRTSYSNVPS